MRKLISTIALGLMLSASFTVSQTQATEPISPADPGAAANVQPAAGGGAAAGAAAGGAGAGSAGAAAAVGISGTTLAAAAAVAAAAVAVGAGSSSGDAVPQAHSH